MKLGIVAMGLESSQDFRSAGVARYAFGLLDALTDSEFKEHEFHFFLLPSFQPPESWRAASHIKIHRTWTRYNRWTLLVSGLVARRLGLDFLLTTANTVPIVSPVPTGVFIHDLFPLDHPEWFPEATATVNQKTIPKAVRHSTLVFANSEATRADVLRHFNVADDKVVVTPLAGGNMIAPLPATKINRTQLGSLGIPYSRYVLTLSTIEPRKNLTRLLEAFAMAVQAPNFNEVGLVVAGSKGWKYDDALEKIHSLGLADRVKLIGYVDEQALPLLFAAAEFYICPSISEGFGMPLVEAMAAGVPVLSSNGGALPEVGGNAVRYFDPLSADEMAAAMIDAISDCRDRANWIRAGQDRAALFTWPNTARSTLSAIRRSLAS